MATPNVVALAEDILTFATAWEWPISGFSANQNISKVRFVETSKDSSCGFGSWPWALLWLWSLQWLHPPHPEVWRPPWEPPSQVLHRPHRWNSKIFFNWSKNGRNMFADANYITVVAKVAEVAEVAEVARNFSSLNSSKAEKFIEFPWQQKHQKTRPCTWWPHLS